MKKIIEPCGLHCIKMNHLGVTIGNQTILEDGRTKSLDSPGNRRS